VAGHFGVNECGLVAYACQQNCLASGVPHDHIIFAPRSILDEALRELRRRSHRPARIHPPCIRHGGGRIVDSSVDARRPCKSGCPSGGSRNDGADARPRRVDLLFRRRRARRIGSGDVRQRQADVRRGVHAGTDSTSVSDGARTRRRGTGTGLDVHTRRTPGLGLDSARGRLQGVCRRSPRPRPIAVSPRRQRTVPGAKSDVGKPVGTIHAA
jgi:hypothetical protein